MTQIAERFNKPSPVSRVLIIQLGDIGDVVWSLPALRAVRDSYPAATLAVLVREGNGSLLAAESSPPMIFEVQRKESASTGKHLLLPLRLVWELRRERFDFVLDFRGDERGGYMAFLTGAPVRAAWYYPDLAWLRSLLFTHLLKLPPGNIPPPSAADYALYLLRAFGVEASSVVPELKCSDEVLLRAQKILADEGISSIATDQEGDRSSPEDSCRWVTVNPFSRWFYKEWSPGKWIQIIDWLWREFDIASVIVGSPSEGRRADELRRTCTGKVYNLAGKTTLAELAGVLKQSRLHIGVDSAAPHIAAAVGTPTVTIYGPSDWRYWAPPGKLNRFIVSDMACVPCHQKGCDGGGTSRCLDTLDAAAVQSVIREGLSR